MSHQNGNGGVSLASRFKQKVSAVSKPLALPVPGIPGDKGFTFECILRRVSVVTMLSEGGELPEGLANKVMGLRPTKAMADAQAQASAMIQQEMTIADLKAIEAFQEKVAIETCVEPKLASGKAPEDADPDTIYLDDLPFKPQLITALYNYATALSPDVPVATLDGGETTLTAVESFRPQTPGDEFSGSGEGGRI